MAKSSTKATPQGSSAKSSKLASDIFDTLQRQILSGALVPGDRLPAERELAAEFHTNRNTLREAIRRLEHSNMVTVRHGQGVTVSDFRRTGTIELLGPFMRHGRGVREKVRMMTDLLPARARLFEYIVMLATERALDQDLARLRDASDLLLSAVEEGDGRTVASSYFMWFDALVEAAHSTPIRWAANPLLDALRAVLQDYSELWLMEPRLPAFMRDVLAAIEAGEEEEAGRITREYFENVDELVVQMLEAVIRYERRVPEGPNNEGR